MKRLTSVLFVFTNFIIILGSRNFDAGPISFRKIVVDQPCLHIKDNPMFKNESSKRINHLLRFYKLLNVPKSLSVKLNAIKDDTVILTKFWEIVLKEDNAFKTKRIASIDNTFLNNITGRPWNAHKRVKRNSNTSEDVGIKFSISTRKVNFTLKSIFTPTKKEEKRKRCYDFDYSIEDESKNKKAYENHRFFLNLTTDGDDVENTVKGLSVKKERPKGGLSKRSNKNLKEMVQVKNLSSSEDLEIEVVIKARPAGLAGNGSDVENQLYFYQPSVGYKAPETTSPPCILTAAMPPMVGSATPSPYRRKYFRGTHFTTAPPMSGICALCGEPSSVEIITCRGPSKCTTTRRKVLAELFHPIHLEESTTEKGLMCPVCGSRLAHIKQFDMSYRAHPNSNRRRIQCPFCRLANLQGPHIYKGCKKLTCPICGGKWKGASKDQKASDSSEDEIRSPSEKYVICGLCGERRRVRDGPMDDTRLGYATATPWFARFGVVGGRVNPPTHPYFERKNSWFRSSTKYRPMPIVINNEMLFDNLDEPYIYPYNYHNFEDENEDIVIDPDVFDGKNEHHLHLESKALQKLRNMLNVWPNRAFVGYKRR